MEGGDPSSGSASFVKRRKPKGVATRVSSAYDEVDDASQAAGPSAPTTASGASRSSTPRQMLSRGGSDEEQEPDAGGVVFRPRARGARATPTAASTAKPVTRGVGNGETVEDENDDDDVPALAPRRSKVDGARRPARMSGVGMSARSSSSASTPKRSTPLRPTAFKDMPTHEQAEGSTSTPTSSLYTSKHLEELRTSTPTARSRAHSPAPAPPGPATFMDDPMAASSSRPGLAAGDDDALTRSKYAADFEHDAIPSESVIRAAKERRAKLRAAGASSGVSDDFISLAPFSRSSAVQAYDAMEVDDGPHPHSRLQREEDELGDGEDEFAEYTGASERIPIGAKAQEELQRRQRRQMEAAVRGDFDDDAPGAVADEMDEDEEEWERAQLRRTQPSAAAASREASPFRAAPIPDPAPVPSVGTCSARLQLTLRALDQSKGAADAVLASSLVELDGLAEAEKQNKLDVTAVEDKASWFDELDGFVASLARFAGEKKARVNEIESDAVALIARRTALLNRARAAWLQARWEEAFGTRPTKSLIPSIDDDEEKRESSLPDHLTGKAASVLPKLDELAAADQLSLDLAKREIIDRLNATFSDVQAPEYLDPLAPIDAGASDSDSPSGLAWLRRTRADWTALHPRSVVVRFEEWRRRYPDEYAQVWGGLSVGQIWEFYARLEMVAWDAFRTREHSGWTAGVGALVDFRWFTGASEYTERAMRHPRAPLGGDDEVLTSLTTNVLVPRLVAMLSAGGVSVWSLEEVEQLVGVVDIVQTVLDDTHARYISLAEAVLGVFASQIQRLQDSVGEIHGLTGNVMAAAHVLKEMLGLVRNAVMLARVIKPSSATDSPTALVGNRLVLLVEQLSLAVVHPIIGRLHESPTTQQLAAAMRQALIHEIPPTITAHNLGLTAFTASGH
ncbi:hypothetical protein PaG_02320 [Moesziomyces aphidis]|uniref:GCF C-terminal domain-containing protein n=1 Tax=Moesziomyces aphidis TaxID=84754 RepID=W3VQY7_MOEAP|nr:hypothetical protein PaG_02320 [Moesziomyces aphidis]